MNAAEQIVEQYLQLCKHCFTMADVKVEDGNNRQLDLLAINPAKKTQYHIEVSVTHDLGFAPDANKLRAEFDRKFRGLPPARTGKGTDHAKGKLYLDAIKETYDKFGLNPDKVVRVYCCWVPKNQGDAAKVLKEYADKTRLKIEVWSLRDKVIPELLNKISTTNYDHPILRTMSLLKQYNKQQPKNGNKK